MLLLTSGGKETGRITIESTATFEIEKAARDAFSSLSTCALFGDVLLLLPDDLYRRVNIDPPALAMRSRPIITEQAPLKPVEVVLGDMAVCGIPCVDFSSIGQRQGL